MDDLGRNAFSKHHCLVAPADNGSDNGQEGKHGGDFDTPGSTGRSSADKHKSVHRKQGGLMHLSNIYRVKTGGAGLDCLKYSGQDRVRGGEFAQSFRVMPLESRNQ